MSKNEVVKKEENVLAVVGEEVASADWGAVEEIDSQDLLIPKIFHQQALSKFAADGIARPGDFCDSLTGEVLAKKEENLQIIIFGVFKNIVISRFDEFTKKFKLDKIVVINKENAAEYANKPLIEEVRGEKTKYNLQYNFYCLLPSKINELPYVLTLGSTKIKIAKKINTMIAKLAQLKKPGASIVFDIVTTQEKNDQGSWFGLDVHQGRASTAEELKIAYGWYQRSKTQKLVANEEVEGETTHEASFNDNDVHF